MAFIQYLNDTAVSTVATVTKTTIGQQQQQHSNTTNTIEREHHVHDTCNRELIKSLLRDKPTLAGLENYLQSPVVSSVIRKFICLPQRNEVHLELLKFFCSAKTCTSSFQIRMSHTHAHTETERERTDKERQAVSMLFGRLIALFGPPQK